MTAGMSVVSGWTERARTASSQHQTKVQLPPFRTHTLAASEGVFPKTRYRAALSSIHNRLLSRLKPKQLDRLHPDLKPVHLSVKDILHERGSRLEHAYFPQSGMVSFVIRLLEGDAVEAGTVGSEGMVGIGLLVGAERGLHEAMVQ